MIFYIVVFFFTQGNRFVDVTGLLASLSWQFYLFQIVRMPVNCALNCLKSNEELL
jgi:hypothetical protein